MLIKNCWYVAANSQELTDGRILARTILNTPVALYRLANGKAVAAYDRCPHRFAPISIGKVIGDSIRCGYHGARFDGRGLCVAVPGQDAAPKRVGLTIYPVRERYGFIWIWMGDLAQADQELAGGAFAPAGDPRWRTGNGLFQSLKASFHLVNDNLFDVTHAEYVHPESFGGPEALLYRTMVPSGDFVEGKMTYEMMERGLIIRSRATKLGNLAGPFFRWMVATGLGKSVYDSEIDTELEITWAAPAFIAFRGTANPTEAADARFTGLNLHAVTPETATSSHYFYRAHWDFGAADAEFAAGYLKNIHDIFEQDRRVLELQQQRIGERDLFDQSPVSFAGDIVQVRARKIIKELERAESI